MKKLSETPYLIGITGGFGTGKSFVGKVLKEAGYFVIDTDEIVSDILKSKNKITLKIVDEFGEEIKNTSGNYINKKSLAEIIFNDNVKRKKLESIVHPEVENRLSKIINLNKNQKVIFVLIPLLFECKLEKNYNETWCVVCDEKSQLQRIKSKGFSEKEAILRINAQMPLPEKAKRAHYVIDNNGKEENTKKQVLERINLILKQVQ